MSQIKQALLAEQDRQGWDEANAWIAEQVQRQEGARLDAEYEAWKLELEARQPRVTRTVQLVTPPSDSTAGIIRIVAVKEGTDYFLTRLPSDFGTAYRLEKLW